MAEREVKVKVKLIGELGGIDPVKNLDELKKRVAQQNKELEGSYHTLTQKEVDNAVATEKLTGKKSKLIEAFKRLGSEVPVVGGLLAALRNPITAVGAAFAASKMLIEAWAAKINEASARYEAFTRAMESLDFKAIAEANRKAAAEWAAELNQVGSAAQEAVKALEVLKVMTEGTAGIKQKVATARAQAEIAQVNQQVESGAMTREEGARRIAAINARAAREGQDARRESTVSQVGAIDRQMAALEARRKGLIAGAPSDAQMNELRLRNEAAEKRKEDVEGIKTALKKAQADYDASNMEMSGSGPVARGFIDMAYGLLPEFMGGGTVRGKNQRARRRVEELQADLNAAQGTIKSEQDLFTAAQERRATVGKEVGEIDSTLGGLRGRRESLIVTQGIADSEAGALRPFAQQQNEIGFRTARSQDAARAAQVQAEANRSGAAFISSLQGAAGEWNRTMDRASQIMRNTGEAARAARLNDQ